MKINDENTEKAELLLNALDYALTHNLDIHKKEDVEKILKTLDPEHTSEEEVKEFMCSLQDADTIIDMLSRKKTKKSDLPN